MAKKKVETTEEVVQEQTIEQPKVDDTVEKIKVKKKPSMKKFSNDLDGVTKVDLSKSSKTKEDEQPVDVAETKEVQEEVVEETTDKKEVVEQSTEENAETPVLEEITDEDDVEVEATKKQVEEAVAEAEATGKPIPEKIQKLMDFIEETGGPPKDFESSGNDVLTGNFGLGNFEPR